MATITVQDLQDIAVKCTSDFFNHEIPLNKGLAKLASEMHLNSDQLKRAVEAVNTLTYLKSMEMSSDKTSEFPVADYREIVKEACVPEGLAKEAKVQTDAQAPGPLQTVPKQYEDLALSAQEKMAYFVKEASANRRALHDATEQMEVVTADLLKLAKEIKNDPNGVRELSASSLSDAKFTKLAGLIFGGQVKRIDYAGFIQKSASQGKVESFIKLYDTASHLHSEIKRRSDLDVAAKNIEKTAFITGAVAAGGKMLSSAGNKTLSTGARGLGFAAAKTVGFAPKMLGKALGSVASGTSKIIGDVTKTQAHNLVARTERGKAIGMQVKKMSPTTVKRIGTGMAVTGALGDATMYSPKVDPVNDRSGSVWEAL